VLNYKNCKFCKLDLPLDSFSKGQGKFKKLNTCKKCDAKRRKEDYATLPNDVKKQRAHKQKISEYKRIYGLPDEMATKLANNREGSCAICEETRFLVVDHCHKTGIFRGLLCQHCNSVLGYAKDNVDILKNAINYLKENSNV
jgi:hypothetical protein